MFSTLLQAPDGGDRIISSGKKHGKAGRERHELALSWDSALWPGNGTDEPVGKFSGIITDTSSALSSPRTITQHNHTVFSKLKYTKLLLHRVSFICTSSNIGRNVFLSFYLNEKPLAALLSDLVGSARFLHGTFHPRAEPGYKFQHETVHNFTSCLGSREMANL
jgi:hypothetical protein